MVKLNSKQHKIAEEILSRRMYNLDFYPDYAHPIITMDNESEFRVQLGCFIFHSYDFNSKSKPTMTSYFSKVEKLEKLLNDHPLTTERILEYGVNGNVGWVLTGFYTPREVKELILNS